MIASTDLPCFFQTEDLLQNMRRNRSEGGLTDVNLDYVTVMSDEEPILAKPTSVTRKVSSHAGVY